VHPTLAEYVADNQAASARLFALVDELTDEELATPVGEHWTIAIILLHLAYWDRRNAAILERNRRDLWAPEGEPDWMDDVQNDALLDEWRLIPAPAAVALLKESVRRINAAAAALSENLVEYLLARDEVHLMRRSRHRYEHIEQIEAVLGR